MGFLWDNGSMMWQQQQQQDFQEQFAKPAGGTISCWLGSEQL
jgi:hypothetical protein